LAIFHLSCAHSAPDPCCRRVGGDHVGNARLFAVQALAVVCTVAFAAPVTALVLARLRAVGSLRIPLPNEMSGVDVSEHGERAYDDGEMSALSGGGLGISEPVFLPTTARIAARSSEAASRTLTLLHVRNVNSEGRRR
jgi:Ammonium Transporter Family